MARTASPPRVRRLDPKPARDLEKWSPPAIGLRRHTTPRERQQDLHVEMITGGARIAHRQAGRLTTARYPAASRRSFDPRKAVGGTLGATKRAEPGVYVSNNMDGVSSWFLLPAIHRGATSSSGVRRGVRVRRQPGELRRGV